MIILTGVVLLFSTLLYPCEIKFKKRIGAEIIKDVSQKIDRLKYPKHYSIKSVLIYEGQLSSALEKEHYFFRLINFGDLLG